MDDFGFYEETLAAWDRGDFLDSRFFFSVGIHPSSALEDWDIERMRRLASHER